MNNFSGLGRLTSDVDLRYTQNGIAIGMFTLAINRPFKNKETNEYDADFIRCKIFRKPAEVIAEHVKKGQQLAVRGRIETGSYEKDGQRVYTTEVVVDEFTFVGSQQTSNSEKQSEQQSQSYSDPFADDGQPIDIGDDDLPF